MSSWVLSPVEYWLGIGQSPRESIEKGIEMVQKAIAMDDSVPIAHGLLGHFYSLKREHDKAIAEGERAVVLEPGGEVVHGFYGTSLNFAGRSEEAIPMYQKAIRLNPFGTTAIYLNFGNALRHTGGMKKRFRHIRRQSSFRLITSLPSSPGRYIYQDGPREGARAEAAEVLRINPKFSVDNFARHFHIKINR